MIFTTAQITGKDVVTYIAGQLEEHCAILNIDYIL